MRFFDRIAARAALKFRARIDRFKLQRRSFVREQLLDDPRVAEAVREHTESTGASERESWARVEGYIQEIVPFFNIIAYYAVGYRIAHWVLNLFYKVSVEYEDRARLARL